MDSQCLDTIKARWLSGNIRVVRRGTRMQVMFNDLRSWSDGELKVF